MLISDWSSDVCSSDLQSGLLRPLSAEELSDGTLRYLLLAVALLSTEPPPLIVLNEPESSLHPDLLTPLAELIAAASVDTQVVVEIGRASGRERVCQYV